MNYLKYTFQAEPDLQEILMALLADWPFDTFEESPAALHAFVPQKDHDEDLQVGVQELAAQFEVTYKVEEIPYQNWNAVWESNFQPIRIDDFCAVRADFHPVQEGVKYELLINPRMAFGTGHHATTYMVMQLMSALNFGGSKVFDFGCGSGILAILAAQMGAAEVHAVDIEEPSYENTIDNARLNGVENQVQAFLGDLSVITAQGFDIILANIHRSVILAAFPALHQKLNNRGTLLISGILLADRDLVLTAANENGFSTQEVLQKGDWIAAKLLKEVPGA
jgi:ribosomal protein L11 methyltransferase